jgi:hypothetical protein
MPTQRPGNRRRPLPCIDRTTGTKRSFMEVSFDRFSLKHIQSWFAVLVIL